MASKRPSIEAMSTVDAAWLHMDTPTNLMMITGLIFFGQPVDFERLKTTLEQRFLRFDRFRQRVAEPSYRFGSPLWVEDPLFDMASHLHRIALPAPGDQTALQNLAGEMMGTPLDATKPLWQFHLIEDYEGGSVLVVRLHHCIADGLSLVRVMLSLTDTDPNAPLISSKPVRRPRRGWSPLRPLLQPAKAALNTSQQLARGLWRTGAKALNNPEQVIDWVAQGNEAALAAGRLVLRPPDPKTLFKGELGVAKRAAWSKPIPLDDVKAIRHAFVGTVNDVMLAAVAGALRRYMQSRKEPVEGVDFRAVIPVDLRNLNNDDLANLNRADIKLGNRFGLVFLSLPIGIADPIERLRKVKERMDALKDSQEAPVAFGILNAIGAAPTQIENLVVKIFGTKATSVITNVRGPQQQLYFAGSPISQLMFWVPQSGRLGLGVSILSYNHAVSVGVATDARLVPDPDAIIAGFHEEFETLRAQAAPVLQRVTRQLDAAAISGNVIAPAAAKPPAAEAPANVDDLTRIKGVGPIYADKLRAAGIDSFAALAASTAEFLKVVCQSELPDYQLWIEQARAISEEKA